MIVVIGDWIFELRIRDFSDLGIRVFDWGKPDWGFNYVTEREIIQTRLETCIYCCIEEHSIVKDYSDCNKE